jgi:hypothetical protein
MNNQVSGMLFLPAALSLGVKEDGGYKVSPCKFIKVLLLMFDSSLLALLYVELLFHELTR